MTFFECFYDFVRIVVDIVVEILVEIAVDKFVEFVNMLARFVNMIERFVDKIVRFVFDFELFEMLSNNDFKAFVNNMINIHVLVLIDTKSFD